MKKLTKSESKELKDFLAKALSEYKNGNPQVDPELIKNIMIGIILNLQQQTE